MKTFIKTLLMMTVVILCGCLDDNNDAMAQNTMTQKMYITIDGVTQPVTLDNNSATQALVAKLQQGSVTVKLNSSGGFEIWGALGFSLPTSNEQITAQPGDVILYNGSNICLMYGSNSWSYTRLGHIDGLSESELRTFLKAGESNINVTLSLAPSNTKLNKTLVAYYSYTGNCREIVQTLTSQIEADVVEIQTIAENQDYNANNYALGNELLENINNNPNSLDSYPPIKPVDKDCGDYDIIIFVTPLWHSQMAAPAQTYLFMNRDKLAGKKFGMIVSSWSSGISTVVANARRLAPDVQWVGESLWINHNNHSNRATLIQNWLVAIDYETIAGTTTVTGDLNGDHLVDVSDVSLLIDVVLGKEVILDEGAQPDLNGDGNTDVTDVSMLIDIVLGKQTN